MKIRIRLTLLFTFCALLAKSQLYISPGANLYLSGNAQLTLDYVYFINDGTFTPGTSTVSFVGSNGEVIMGNQSTSFYNLKIATVTAPLYLFKNISVANELLFTTGAIDLNGNDIDLGSTGYITGESETAGIYTSLTGNVIATANLNAPSNANPGNLGAVISSSQNLGAVTIRRRHTSLAVTGIGKSIKRSYSIEPATNTSLNATLTLNYFDRELNTLNEADLSIWNTMDNTTWLNRGRSGFSTSSNYVTKTGVNSFGIETLSRFSNPLPVNFISFNQQCDNGRVRLQWKTAMEQNSLRFLVEKSEDGLNWTSIGTVPAAGNSTEIRSYDYWDTNIYTHILYRIIEYDNDGRKTISSILRSSCGSNESFQVWPNPFRDQLNLQIHSARSRPAALKLYNSAGLLVQTMNVLLMAGNNSILIPVGQLASGVYQLDAGGRVVRLLKSN